jgi:hypothetical protein
MPITHKAKTPAQKRQWRHIEESELAAGKSPKIAAMAANSAVAKHPSRKKK